MIYKICGVNDRCWLIDGRCGGISDHVYVKVGWVKGGREPEMRCYRDKCS